MDKMNRREFLKTAGAAGAAAVFGSMLPLHKAYCSAAGYEPELAGISDIHIHAAPDVKDRLINELEFAQRAKAAGYRSVMFKSNEWSCHDRVYLIRQAVPDFEVFGSLCMNFTHGDKINVYAAKMALQTTGNYCRYIWMPTQAARYPFKLAGKSGGIDVLDGSGRVVPEAVQVMELCAEADIIFATGHCSPEESLVLARKAKEVGVKKFVVTHANSRIWRMTADQIKQVVELGGWIEYSFLPVLWGPGSGMPGYPRLSVHDFLAYAKICPERSFISTDMGQVKMPDPLEAMKECVHILKRGGVAQRDIDLLLKRNPAHLTGLV